MQLLSLKFLNKNGRHGAEACGRVPFSSPRRASSSTNFIHSTMHLRALSSAHPEPCMSNKLIKLIDTLLGLVKSTLQEDDLGFLPHRTHNQGNLKKPSNLSQSATCPVAFTIGRNRPCHLLIKGQRFTTRPNELFDFLTEPPK